MRGSHLFSLGQNRVMLPEEHLLVQGVPVPELLAPDSWLAEYYPLSRPVDAYAGTLWRRLCGNGMHWSQVGSALLLAFARAAEVGVTRVAPRAGVSANDCYVGLLATNSAGWWEAARRLVVER